MGFLSRPSRRLLIAQPPPLLFFFLLPSTTSISTSITTTPNTREVEDDENYPQQHLRTLISFPSMKFFGSRHANTASHDVAVGPEPSYADHEHEKQPPVSSDDDVSIEKPSEDVQGGVKKSEAITLTWTKGELIVAYIAIFLVFFVVSMEEQILGNLGPYVTSSFALLPLTATTNILSSIIGGVSRLPIAKFIDIVGRAEGFCVLVGCATIGLIMMAATRNVEMYCAAQVFYWVGFDGMAYILDVVMADTSSLKNRALVFAFSTSPYIATTFIGPPAANSFLKTSGWPWGFGTFAIVNPIAALPIIYLLFRNQRKAFREGLIAKEKSGRTFLQSVVYYFWDFDFIGILLITAGFSLFLLPFSLETYQGSGWSTPFIIAMLVLGPVFLIAFVLYEKYLCPKTFLPWEILADRSMIGACLTACFIFISFYCWDSTFLSYLQAVHGLSVTNAGYLYNTYSIGSCFWAIVVAFLIRVTKRFKWLALASVALLLLGNGLMIHFRQPNQGIGFVVMCQIFIAFGGGALNICDQMAVMATAPHQNVAGVLAVLSLFSSVGGAIGAAISTAIYTNKFPAALNAALPGNATLNAELYGSLPTQLSYPFGSPERTAVIAAYGHSQFYQTLAGTCFMVPCFVFVGIWKNFKVSELKQVKGRVA